MANGTVSEVLGGQLVRAPARRSDSLWAEAARRFRRHRLAMVGLVVLTAMVLAVVVGPFVYRVPIDEIDFRAKLKAPSSAHPFGTDDLGQDILARILYGGRISLAVGVVAMLIGICVGHDGRGRRRSVRWRGRQRPDAVDRPLPVAPAAADLPAGGLSVP